MSIATRVQCSRHGRQLDLLVGPVNDFWFSTRSTSSSPLSFNHSLAFVDNLFLLLAIPFRQDVSLDPQPFSTINANQNRNVTTSFFNSPTTYSDYFQEVAHYNVHLSVFEKAWAAWYAYMQNDVLATGIMSFMMHEIVYFGRCIPWIIADKIAFFKQYKIQGVCSDNDIELASSNH